MNTHKLLRVRNDASGLIVLREESFNFISLLSPRRTRIRVTTSVRGSCTVEYSRYDDDGALTISAVCYAGTRAEAFVKIRKSVAMKIADKLSGAGQYCREASRMSGKTKIRKFAFVKGRQEITVNIIRREYDNGAWFNIYYAFRDGFISRLAAGEGATVKEAMAELRKNIAKEVSQALRGRQNGYDL